MANSSEKSIGKTPRKCHRDVCKWETLALAGIGWHCCSRGAAGRERFAAARLAYNSGACARYSNEGISQRDTFQLKVFSKKDDNLEDIGSQPEPDVPSA